MTPSSTPAAVSLRQITPEDAPAAAQLSEELGYPVAIDEMLRRIAHLSIAADRVVFVACVANTVTAWIEVAIVHHLTSGPTGEVSGLVVSHEHRNKGIGRQLMLEAERWVAAGGAGRMVVRSRLTRPDAHRFYLREGYEQIKTSAVFAKTLHP